MSKEKTKELVNNVLTATKGFGAVLLKHWKVSASIVTMAFVLALLVALSTNANKKDNNIYTLEQMIKKGYEVVVRGTDDKYVLYLKDKEYVIVTKDEDGNIYQSTGKFPVSVTTEVLAGGSQVSASSRYLKNIVEVEGKHYYLYTSTEWIKLVEIPGEPVEMYYGDCSEGSIVKVELSGSEYMVLPKDISSHAKHNNGSFEAATGDEVFEVDLIPYNTELFTYNISWGNDALCWEMSETYTYDNHSYYGFSRTVEGIKNYLNLIVPRTEIDSFLVQKVSYAKALETIEEIKNYLEKYESNPSNAETIAEGWVEYFVPGWFNETYGGVEWYNQNKNLVSKVAEKLALEKNKEEVVDETTSVEE